MLSYKAMRFFLFFAFLLSLPAAAQPACDSAYIGRRLRTYMNPSYLIQGDMAVNVARAMREDPCWNPALYQISVEEVATIERVRSDANLPLEIQRLDRLAEISDPLNELHALARRYPDLIWDRGPLAIWSSKILQAWTDLQAYNSEEACPYKRIAMPPVREQQNPWCAFMVGADLLGQASGRYLSPADLALTYGRRPAKPQEIVAPFIMPQPLFSTHGATSLGAAVEAGLARGLCLEKNFRSGRINGVHSSFILRDYLNESFAGHVSPATSLALKSLFAGLPKSGTFGAPYSYNALRSVADRSCGARIQFAGLRMTDRSVRHATTSNAEGHALIAEIDRVLRSGRIVGLGLNADVIDAGTDINATDGHAVSVVGRRFNAQTKRCEYLVRNSAGPDYGDGGYKYIPRDRLLGGISELTYFPR